MDTDSPSDGNTMTDKELIKKRQCPECGRLRAELARWQGARTPALGSAFVIQRPEYPNWFAGWNAVGPIWTSSMLAAHEIRPDLLVGYMVQLAKHKPHASLLPKHST